MPTYSITGGSSCISFLDRHNKVFTIISAVALIVATVAMAIFLKFSFARWPLIPITTAAVVPAITLLITAIRQRVPVSTPAPATTENQPLPQAEAEEIFHDCLDAPTVAIAERGDAALQAHRHVLTPVTETLLPQLKQQAKELFNTILDLYGNCYNENVQSRKEKYATATEALASQVKAKLEDPNCFIWLALDSVNHIGNPGVGVLARLEELAKNEQNANELILVIQKWWNHSQYRALPSITDRDAFVNSYLGNTGSADLPGLTESIEQETLGHFFCQLIEKRLEAVILNDVIGKMNKAAQKLNNISRFLINDTTCSLELYYRIDKYIAGTPIIQLKDALIAQVSPLMTPIAFAIKPGTPFNEVMKSILAEINLTKISLSNLGDLIEKFKKLAALHLDLAR